MWYWSRIQELEGLLHQDNYDLGKWTGLLVLNVERKAGMFVRRRAVYINTIVSAVL